MGCRRNLYAKNSLQKIRIGSQMYANASQSLFLSAEACCADHSLTILRSATSKSAERLTLPTGRLFTISWPSVRIRQIA